MKAVGELVRGAHLSVQELFHLKSKVPPSTACPRYCSGEGGKVKATEKTKINDEVIKQGKGQSLGLIHESAVASAVTNSKKQN